MTKRIVTKIGDVFCANVENEFKRYFQYIVNDFEQLNSSVIRVFKTHYLIDSNPKIEDVVKDNIDFYAHAVLRSGLITDSWCKVGNSKNIGDFSKMLFRQSEDSGNPNVEISEKWYIWRVNEPKIFVGKLPLEYQYAEDGSVMTYSFIMNRLKYGKYTHVYPGY